MNSPVPPDEFICPLTKQLMSVPVVSRYGIHFEKKAILEWLAEGNNFCPVTGNPLRPSNLISDPTLQWKIQYVSLSFFIFLIDGMSSIMVVCCVFSKIVLSTNIFAMFVLFLLHRSL